MGGGCQAGCIIRLPAGAAADPPFSFLKSNSSLSPPIPLRYAASHGFTIAGAAGHLDSATDTRPLLADACASLPARLAAAGLTGCGVEDNTASVSVHFRQLVNPTEARLASVKNIVDHAAAAYGGALEVRCFASVLTHAYTHAV